MRDRLKSKEFFEQELADQKERIRKFEEVFESLDPSNISGIENGRLIISDFYRDYFKMAYSAGWEIDEIIPFYVEYLRYYKDVCSDIDSLYDLIDIYAIGVLLYDKKDLFEGYLDEIAGRFPSKAGLVNCLLSYIKDRPYQPAKSIFAYFNDLMNGEKKEDILKDAMKKWYRKHKSAYWYDMHKSKANVYYGYWSYEIAALVKILNADDSGFRDHDYYPRDLVRYQAADMPEA